MSTTRILINKNEIISESACKTSYSGASGKYSLITVFKGQSDHIIGKRRLTLYPERFIFLNETTCYSRIIDPSREVNLLTLLFDPVFVSDFEYSIANNNRILLDCPINYLNGKPVFIEAIHALNNNLRGTLTKLKNEADHGAGNRLLLGEYLNNCIESYYDLYHHEVTNRAESLKFLNRSTKSEIIRRLSIAKDYMISNYNKNIGLEDIALTACLSVNHLLRTFKQAYHQSPHQFLINVRLEQAKYYLRNTNYPVNEIVDIIGFECPSSFIRLFRSSFKITPGQYR